MNWEDTMKRYPFRENSGESSFYTKRKLRALLELLNSDANDFSKVHQAIGFVESMLKQMSD